MNTTIYYFSGIPVMLKNFMENLQINKHNYVFAIATCGGSVGTSLIETNLIEMT